MTCELMSIKAFFSEKFIKLKILKLSLSKDENKNVVSKLSFVIKKL